MINFESLAFEHFDGIETDVLQYKKFEVIVIDWVQYFGLADSTVGGCILAS
jgi:hypothetical protein